jgi:hypothetical protein
MSDPLLQLRMFDRDKDHAMLAEWCDAHGSVVTPACLLPPLGVVVQQGDTDSAALFFYMALACPVGFVDCAATRPKLSMKESIDCFEFAMNFLKNEARVNGYAVIICHSSKPVARVMGRLGFNTAEEGLVRTFATTDAS